MMVLGTVDLHQAFIPVALMVTSGETSADYLFFLQIFQEVVAVILVLASCCFNHQYCYLFFVEIHRIDGVYLKT